METEATCLAKTAATSCAAQRKQKASGIANSSLDWKYQSSSQCCPSSMKPQAVEKLVAKPKNHLSIIKVLIHVSIVVLFVNLISIQFNYPFLPTALFSGYSFSFSSVLNSSHPSSPSSPPYSDSYSPSNLDPALPNSGRNFSSDSNMLEYNPSILDTSLLEFDNHTTSSSQSSSNPVSSSSPPPRPYCDLVSSSSLPPQPYSEQVSFASPPQVALPLLPPPTSSISSPPTALPPSPQALPTEPQSYPALVSSLAPQSPLLKPSRPLSNSRTVLPQPSEPEKSSSPSVKSEKSINREALKNCDISRGEWVQDWEAPYYTNLTCYTIQEHQNCMKYGRPDTDYLKWRWKLDDCELPLFDPNQFLEIMRCKTMAFVGDSLARNQMQSLMCLLSRVAYPEDVSENSDENFKRMYYAAFDFTVVIYWSPFLVRAKQTWGPEKQVLWNFYLDEVDKVWASKIDKMNYLIISAGNWFNRPSVFYQKRRVTACLYCPNEKVTHLTMHYANQKAIHTAFRAINRSKKFKGTVILRTISISHFENGKWDDGGDCVRTGPYRQNETRSTDDDIKLYKDQIKEFHKAQREGKEKGIDYRLLDITSATLLRPDGHPSRYGHLPEANVPMPNDCVHWCLPGPVDT